MLFCLCSERYVLFTEYMNQDMATESEMVSHIYENTMPKESRNASLDNPEYQQDLYPPGQTLDGHLFPTAENLDYLGLTATIQPSGH